MSDFSVSFESNRSPPLPFSNLLVFFFNMDENKVAFTNFEVLGSMIFGSSFFEFLFSILTDSFNSLTESDTSEIKFLFVFVLTQLLFMLLLSSLLLLLVVE